MNTKVILENLNSTKFYLDMQLQRILFCGQ
jgi:hypothetical protein